MTTNILFKSKLFSLLFFCVTAEPLHSLALTIPSHQQLTLSSCITPRLPSTASSLPPVPGYIQHPQKQVISSCKLQC